VVGADSMFREYLIVGREEGAEGGLVDGGRFLGDDDDFVQNGDI
jgi:hypothetical protein